MKESCLVRRYAFERRVMSWKVRYRETEIFERGRRYFVESCWINTKNISFFKKRKATEGEFFRSKINDYYRWFTKRRKIQSRA